MSYRGNDGTARHARKIQEVCDNEDLSPNERIPRLMSYYRGLGKNDKHIFVGVLCTLVARVWNKPKEKAA